MEPQPQESVKTGSPNDFNKILPECLVRGKDRQPLGSRLSDQHPVKRILVNGWQTCEDRNVGWPEREDDAAAEIRCARPPVYGVRDI